MIILTNLIKEHLIYEGLIHSVAINKIIDMLERWSTTTEEIKIQPSGQKILIHFKRNLTEPELDNFLRLINNLGWFVSVYSTFGYLGKWKKFDRSEFLETQVSDRILSMQLEAKYDLELDPYSLDILYHSSPSINDKKVKRIGLVPKNREKISIHPERLYLARMISDLDIITERFFQLNRDVSKYTYYSIDIPRTLADNPTVRLFIDPNFHNGIYTLSNIKPSNLTIIGNRDFSVDK